MDVPWSRAWVITWGVVAVGLIALLWVLPFRWWAVAGLVGFGGLEAFGLWRAHDRYPPLTQVIGKYVPRAVAFTAIYGIWGAAAGAWFHIPRVWRLGVLLALLGFLTTHFDVTFDEGTRQQERGKWNRLIRPMRRRWRPQIPPD